MYSFVSAFLASFSLACPAVCGADWSGGKTCDEANLCLARGHRLEIYAIGTRHRDATVYTMGPGCTRKQRSAMVLKDMVEQLDRYACMVNGIWERHLYFFHHNFFEGQRPEIDYWEGANLLNQHHHHWFLVAYYSLNVFGARAERVDEPFPFLYWCDNLALDYGSSALFLWTALKHKAFLSMCSLCFGERGNSHHRIGR
ncbi:hypothetical protein BDY21DRAFT_90691 [Lineolata rhizophorae]|uniref:Uncharacterized protein n=1 Tax=Lineolata rhizophorae TaxID=578093 RepID=A0A6A6PCA1_9PEZI|nr:hypothetical protein BDY21DRAFT_90691 [Lineolata rhizophorae]